MRWNTAFADATGGPGRSTVELALRLTAVELLLRPLGGPATRPAALGLAALAVLFPRILRAPATWLALSGLVALSIALDWPVPDNHIYLIGYWCLAAGLALGARNPAATLSQSGRLLLGGAFLFATLWKGILSPDYVDGRFFRVTLLTDERFSDLVTLTTGMSRDTIEANRRALTPLPGGAVAADPPVVEQPAAFRALAASLTWGGLLLEGALALAFLSPTWPGVSLARHALLLAFCGVTYAVAPVAGFGWLLLAMGVSLCGPGDTWLRRAYVAILGAGAALLRSALGQFRPGLAGVKPSVGTSARGTPCDRFGNGACPDAGFRLHSLLTTPTRHRRASGDLLCPRASAPPRPPPAARS